MLKFSVNFYEIRKKKMYFFLFLYKKPAHKKLAGFMEQIYRPCKTDWKSRETFMLLSFSVSTLVAAYNNRVHKMLWDNCGFYKSVQ